MTDTKTPEALAEEWITHVLETQCDVNYKISFLAGYARGQKDTQERIWEAAKRAQSTAEFHMLGKLAGGVRMSELQQIIFGGSDEQK